VETTDKADTVRVTRISSLAKSLLDVSAKSSAAQSDKDRGFYEGKALAIDREIDELVYELYRLSERDISAIESIEAAGVT